MCIAAPGKVIKIEGKIAIVEYSGGEVRQAMILDIKPLTGDYVLVQMGIVVEKISKIQSNTAKKAWV